MSLMLVAIIAIVLWIGAFGFYLYTSKQHGRIEAEIEKVQRLIAERDQATQA